MQLGVNISKCLGLFAGSLASHDLKGLGWCSLRDEKLRLAALREWAAQAASARWSAASDLRLVTVPE